MRIRVDPKLCEAHALCIDLAPEVFDLGDDTATCAPEVDQSHWDSVEAAISRIMSHPLGRRSVAGAPTLSGRATTTGTFRARTRSRPAT